MELLKAREGQGDGQGGRAWVEEKWQWDSIADILRRLLDPAAKVAA